MRTSRMIVLVALILILPVAGLTPLAYASPPDPSWILGIYDGADYDDVVLLITSATGTTAPSAPADFAKILLVVPLPSRLSSPGPLPPPSCRLYSGRQARGSSGPPLAHVVNGPVICPADPAAASIGPLRVTCVPRGPSGRGGLP
jgi:hypothetical protein